MSTLIAATDLSSDAWRAVAWVLVHGTVLAALAWLLTRTVLRRARPAVIAALWAIVLVKFVVPVGPSMPWSVSSLIDRIAGADTALVVLVPPAPDLLAAPALAPAAGSPAIAAGGVLALLAAGLWLLGASWLATRRIREQRALRRRAAAGLPADDDVLAMVGAAAGRLGLRRAPAVRIEAHGTVPWVVGLHRPVLVLPAGMLRAPADLGAAISHELAHLRRRDAWLRLVQLAVACTFFFWPVVRWVNRRIDAAREQACDAWAVAHGPLAAPAYARMLVRLVRARAAAPHAALALAADPALLGRRVDALLGGTPRAGVGALGALALAGWGVVALGGAASATPTRAAPPPCTFRPELASSMLAAYPEADADGDGQLTRNEACDFELELRRRWVDANYAAPGVDALDDGARDRLAAELPASVLGDSLSAVEELSCNRASIEATSPTLTCTQE